MADHAQLQPPSRACAYRRRLVIMVKEPVAGRVKTRLGRDVGVSRATGFYRQTLASVTARLARDARWQTFLSVAPAVATASTMLPASLPRLPQHDGDLGQRMQAIFDVSGSGPVVVIGTDIPEVAPRHIAEAFHALGRNDVVFGPAADGGFWLVGMRRTPRLVDLFHAVRWSTPHTLRDCLDGLRRQSWVKVATVATLNDADDRGDLVRVAHAAGRRVLPGRAGCNPALNSDAE